MNSLSTLLAHQFPSLHFQPDYSLALLTTVKIGGPAEVFCEVTERKDFLEVIQFCRKENISVMVIGWGANTLIADRGIKGLVIKYKTQHIQILDRQTTDFIPEKVEDRWQAALETQTVQETFDDLNYQEDQNKKVEVEIDAGVPLSFAINSLIHQGVTGLQWFARIPATIAGAIYNNIHGGRHFFSEYVKEVSVIDSQGTIKILTHSELDFAYDYSRFHNTNEIIVSAQLVLYKGDVEKAKKVVSSWSIQKKHQPQNSLGCVFQNISQEDQRRLGYPTPSVGYIIEHVIGKKGFRIGDAMISQKHAAFIENMGHATAADYLEIIRIILKEIKEKTDLTIKPEIFFKGFTSEELAFLQ